MDRYHYASLRLFDLCAHIAFLMGKQRYYLKKARQALPQSVTLAKAYIDAYRICREEYTFCLNLKQSKQEK